MMFSYVLLLPVRSDNAANSREDVPNSMICTLRLATPYVACLSRHASDDSVATLTIYAHDNTVGTISIEKWTFSLQERRLQRPMHFYMSCHALLDMTHVAPTVSTAHTNRTSYSAKCDRISRHILYTGPHSKEDSDMVHDVLWIPRPGTRSALRYASASSCAA
jgi:hypothetical protein